MSALSQRRNVIVPFQSSNYYFVGVLTCVLFILRKCDSFRDAVQANIRVGGDSCARAILLGAFYAASHFPLPSECSLWADGDSESNAIPLSWLDKCDDAGIHQILADCKKV